MTAIENIVIRDALPYDMQTVQVIYAHEVLTGFATFEEVPPSIAELLKRRDSTLSLGLPYLVADINGTIVGYSYATGYRPRPAYRLRAGAHCLAQHYPKLNCYTAACIALKESTSSGIGVGLSVVDMALE